jgi:hypothetical protein
VSFGPDAEVPDDWGAARLKDSPNIYREAKGEADASQWRTTETSQVESLHQRFDELTVEERAQTLKYMTKLRTDRLAKEDLARAKAEDAEKKKVRDAAEAEARARKEGKQ